MAYAKTIHGRHTYLAFFLLSTVLVLSGCASTRSTPDILPPHTICLQHSAQAHQSWLHSIQTFNLAGSIMVYDEQHQKHHAYFAWQQDHGQFDIVLSGPMGIRPTHLTGNQNRLTLHTPHHKTKKVNTPDHALTLYGHTIPISPHWIKGELLPQSESQTNPKGFIQSMTSGNLTFHYKHKCNQGFWLPKTITLSGEGGEIISSLNIRRWQVKA